MSKHLADYGPYLLILVSSLIAYLFSVRTKRIEKFHKKAEESMAELCGPMLYSLEKFFRDLESKHIHMFFKKFCSQDTSIYKIGNKVVIQRFFKVEKQFQEYVEQVVKDEDALNKLHVELYILKEELEKEYWKNFACVYGDYR